MTLFEAVRENRQLKYIDGDNGKQYSFDQLPLFTPKNYAKKQLAFLYLDNSVNAVSVFWSFMNSNYAIALLSPNIPEAFKTHLEEIYSPACIYDTTRTVIASYQHTSVESTGTFYCEQEHNLFIHEEIKVLLNTSGTTGSPKFVKLSDKNLLSNALSIVDYLPVNGSDVTPLNLPIYYSYGLSVLTSNSIRGGQIVCSNVDVLNKAFWQKMNEYRYTSIAGVPFVYEMLERIGFRKSTYPSLKYMTVAGGKLEQPIMQKFAEYALGQHIAFYVMYGQTEATARMSYVPSGNLINKIGSIGIAIKNGRFDLEPETGELCYSGPNVFGGYVNTPADLATYEQPSLLHTGDLARVDNDGYYYITGRVKRIVKLFGTRINLDEIETILISYCGKAVKCTGINDKILLIAVTDQDIDGADLTRYLAEVTKLHPSVIKVQYIEEYPLSLNGKVDYNKIAELHGAK
jgi:long-chain acyl-CoA synthetase